MKRSTLLESLALGASCAFLITVGRFPVQANAQAAAESAGEILPLVQFENAPLVDVIKTLARQANLNIIIDPKVTAVDETGRSIHPPVSIRMENVTAQNVLEAVLNNNNLRLERDQKVSRVAFNDPAPEGQDIESMPPVVVKTVPESAAKEVATGIVEIKVTFSKEMTDNSWSWSSAWQGSTPEALGKPRYEADRKTCVLKVELERNKTYAYWLNSEKFKNFKDRQGHSAVPYLLAFQTADRSAADQAGAGASPDARLNEDQRRVLAWTDRQFRGFFDARTFDGWSAEERANHEKRLIDTLNGPLTREYYQAISTLAALRSTNALPRLRELAFDRRDKDNRDRWMALRALGILGDTASVPEMIHLVYHGNVNTRWWAQMSLVRLTGQNFGKDWQAWGKWWNESDRQPAYNPEIIRWWNGQPEPDKLADSLDESDRKFIADLQASVVSPK